MPAASRSNLFAFEAKVLTPLVQPGKPQRSLHSTGAWHYIEDTVTAIQLRTGLDANGLFCAYIPFLSCEDISE